MKVPGLSNFPGGGLYDRLGCGVAAGTVCFFCRPLQCFCYSRSVIWPQAFTATGSDYGTLTWTTAASWFGLLMPLTDLWSITQLNVCRIALNICLDCTACGSDHFQLKYLLDLHHFAITVWKWKNKQALMCFLVWEKTCLIQTVSSLELDFPSRSWMENRNPGADCFLQEFLFLKSCNLSCCTGIQY